MHKHTHTYAQTHLSFGAVMAATYTLCFDVWLSLRSATSEVNVDFIETQKFSFELFMGKTRGDEGRGGSNMEKHFLECFFFF